MTPYTIIEPTPHDLDVSLANSAEHSVSTGPSRAIGLDRTEEAYAARYADSQDLYIVQSRGYVDGDSWETVTPEPISEGRARYLADTYSSAGTWMHRAVRVLLTP